MNFDGELITSFDHPASRVLDGEYYRIRKSFRYYLPVGFSTPTCPSVNAARWVFIAAGMLSDLGSIPKVFRGAINPAGKAAQAFVVHDQLCEYLSITVAGRPQRITRADCDLILKLALLDLEIDKTTAELIYQAVRAYGELNNIRDPSTTRIKRDLESAYNFEDFL